MTDRSLGLMDNILFDAMLAKFLDTETCNHDDDVLLIKSSFNSIMKHAVMMLFACFLLLASCFEDRVCM